MIPRGFTEKLQALGVARVHFAYHWHEDISLSEAEAFDHHGGPVALSPDLRNEIEQAMYASDVDLYGVYLWDLDSGIVAPFGQLLYLEGSPEHGTYVIRFEGNEERILQVRQWTPGQPEERIGTWLTDPDPNVRLALAENEQIPRALIRALLGDLSGDVQRTMQLFAPHPMQGEYTQTLIRAGDPHALPMSLKALSHSEFDRVRLAVANNPNTPGRVLSELAAEWPFGLAVLCNPVCPPALHAVLLDRLANEPNSDIRYAVAEDPRTPWALLERWQHDPDPYLRYRVGKHPHTPLAALKALEYDPAEAVQSALEDRAAELSSPTDLSEGEVSGGQLSLAEQWEAARNEDLAFSLGRMPGLFPDVLTYYLGHPRKAQIVAHRSDLTPEQMQTLADSGTTETRRKLAGNPFLPAETAQQLARDPDEWVRVAVAGRPRLPEALQQVLAQDESWWVRLKLTRAAQLLPSTWERLAADPSMSEWLLQNPQVPVSVARQVLERLDGKYSLLPTEHARPELLALFSEYASGSDLLALAHNPATPQSPIIALFRRLLGEGHDPLTFLIADLATPPELLRRLTASEHDLELIRHPAMTAQGLSELVDRRIAARFHRSVDLDVVQPILASPVVTPDIIEKLIVPATFRKEFRLAVAATPHLHPQVYWRLLEDPNTEVIDALRRNGTLPPDLRERLSAP
ncbi:hypothetical protein [Deinococcus marmoris]|uniref:HEAT repeat n=1 Tax=Deinococcus marmoris TaxID=249408 RepID=A0A1U7NZ13_9DEIO|nr:hypothetical protein [Deinococcus marmoris]OLV18157.1 HEAT repeat [Deinococcus marmoris]